MMCLRLAFVVDRLLFHRQCAASQHLVDVAEIITMLFESVETYLLVDFVNIELLWYSSKVMIMM